MSKVPLCCVWRCNQCIPKKYQASYIDAHGQCVVGVVYWESDIFRVFSIDGIGDHVQLVPMMNRHHGDWDVILRLF